MTPLSQPMINLELKDPNTEKNLQKLVIQGEIDRDTIQDFRAKMEEILQNFTAANLMLDLEQLDFINSEGIGYLTDLYNRLQTQNKKMMIIQASDRIMDIFQLVGLNQIVDCFTTEEECLNSL